MLNIARKKQGIMIAGLVFITAAITGSAVKRTGVFATESWQNYYVAAGTKAVPNPELLRNSPRFLHFKYKAGQEDTMLSVAEAYGTDTISLKISNGIKSGQVRQGDEINVLNRSGYLHITCGQETLDSLARRYVPANMTYEAFRQSIVEENDIPPSAIFTDYLFEPGEQVFLPGVSEKKRLIPDSQNFVTINKTSPNVANRKYVFPLSYNAISSYFGYRKHPTKNKQILHKGCDFRAPLGTPVYAAREGTVKVAGWERGYGKTVEILHQDGFVTRYAHLSAINVKKGDKVSQGITKVGEVGKSGVATGYHLHFELITPKGLVQDPLPNMKRLGR